MNDLVQISGTYCFICSPQNMICEDHSSPTYYCDDVDLCWLDTVNSQKKLKGLHRSSTNLGLAFSCLFEHDMSSLAVSKTQAITSENLQKAFVAFDLKVCLFRNSM